MNDFGTLRYEAALRAKQAELLAALKDREGLEAQAQPDLFDEIQSAMDRALVVQTLDRNSAMLRDVQSALARIEEGDYGECLKCGEPISPRRLAAVPWAALCLGCQEEADENEAESSRVRSYGIAA